MFDPVDGKHLILAAVRDAQGEAVAGAPNEIIFRNCFDRLKCSLLFRVTRAGLEQNFVVEERLPDLRALGFSEKSRVEFYTEFHPQTPAPSKTTRVVRSESDLAVRAQMVAPDWTDTTLNFGEMQIGRGAAFAVGANRQSPRIIVAKDYSVIDGRPVLTESVELRALEPLLADLAGQPKPLKGMYAVNSARRIKRSVEYAHAAPASGARTAMSARIATAEKKFADKAVRAPGLTAFDRASRGLRLAEPLRQGAAIDYSMLSSSTHVLAADVTYYASGPVNLSGTNVLEGGAIIKVAPTNNASIVITGSGATLNCLTTPVRPAIFTARDDASVGESIGSTLT
ncbi:MAG: hypothetical protein DME26_02480, partial [Verrucomicrobia bacterium]